LPDLADVTLSTLIDLPHIFSHIYDINQNSSQIFSYFFPVSRFLIIPTFFLTFTSRHLLFQPGFLFWLATFSFSFSFSFTFSFPRCFSLFGSLLANQIGDFPHHTTDLLPPLSDLLHVLTKNSGSLHLTHHILHPFHDISDRDFFTAFHLLKPGKLLLLRFFPLSGQAETPFLH